MTESLPVAYSRSSVRERAASSVETWTGHLEQADLPAPRFPAIHYSQTRGWRLQIARLLLTELVDDLIVDIPAILPQLIDRFADT